MISVISKADERAGDRVDARTQQADEENREDEPLGMRRMPMLKKSYRKTRARKRPKPGSLWVSFSASNAALANFTGGFPATVIGSPSRDRICRRKSYVACRRGDAQEEVGREIPVLGHAVVAGEEIPRHVEPAQLEVLGAVVEHVGEASIGPEHLRVGAGKLRDEVEHDVAFRGTHPRETHAGERPQVLPGDGPGPLSLDAVHSAHSVEEESAPEPARRVQPRRSGGPADEEAAQHESRRRRRPRW